MMFARDKSQMCNNLLQYAHVYAWGREHGRKVCCSMPMSMHGAESMEGKLSPCASVINISISRYATHH